MGVRRAANRETVLNFWVGLVNHRLRAFESGFVDVWFQSGARSGEEGTGFCDEFRKCQYDQDLDGLLPLTSYYSCESYEKGRYSWL